MLAVSHRSFEALPLALYGDMDESGTINPAALNAACKLFLSTIHAVDSCGAWSTSRADRGRLSRGDRLITCAKANIIAVIAHADP